MATLATEVAELRAEIEKREEAGLPEEDEREDESLVSQDEDLATRLKITNSKQWWLMFNHNPAVFEPFDDDVCEKISDSYVENMSNDNWKLAGPTAELIRATGLWWIKGYCRAGRDKAASGFAFMNYRMSTIHGKNDYNSTYGERGDDAQATQHQVSRSEVSYDEKNSAAKGESRNRIFHVVHGSRDRRDLAQLPEPLP
jgi:hypothetical protein